MQMSISEGTTLLGRYTIEAEDMTTSSLYSNDLAAHQISIQ